MKNYFQFFRGYVFKHPFLWCFGLIIPPVFTLVSRLLIAWLNQEVIRKLGVDGMQIQNILMVIGATLLGIVIAEFFVYLFNCSFSRFSLLSEREISQEMYNNIFRARIDKLQTYKTGDIITRYNKDIKASVAFIGKNISGFIYPLFIGIGYCIALIATNLLIGLIAAFIVIVVTLLNIIFVTKFRNIEKQKLKSSAEHMQTTDSALQGRITIRMLGLEDKIGDRINLASDMIVKSQGRYINLSLIKAFTSNFFTLVCATLIFPFACLLVAMETINLPNAVFIASLCGSLMGYTGSLANSMIAIGNDLVSVKRTKELMDIEAEDVMHKEERQQVPEDSSGHLIKLNKVSICYDDTEVLSRVDMYADKGEIIVIAGPSGCGKSSLLKAILRMISYDGEILLNSINIKNLSVDAIRQKIAYVPEKNELIDGDIVHNIKMGNVNADEDQVAKAMRTAALHEFFEDGNIKSCPVGEHGSQLSGGQQQRVAIARAFVKDADILLMDEPTSSLDPVSETEILVQLRDMADKGRTIIVISHRISTIEIADRIVIAKKDELTEDATLEEALKFFIRNDDTQKAANM